MNKLRPEHLLAAFPLMCCVIIAACIVHGCFHESHDAGTGPVVSIQPRHPRVHVKASGLLPILKDFNPKAKALIDGDYVTLAPGVEAHIPADAEIYMTREDDGRVRIDFPNGQKVRINKTILGFIPVQGTENVTALEIDDTGVDVQMQGLLSGVRLEATE